MKPIVIGTWHILVGEHVTVRNCLCVMSAPVEVQPLPFGFSCIDTQIAQEVGRIKFTVRFILSDCSPILLVIFPHWTEPFATNTALAIRFLGFLVSLAGPVA